MSYVRILGFIGLFVPCFAANGVSLSGIVTDPDGRALAKAEVLLVETQQKQVTGGDGRFQFHNVTPGVVHLRAVAVGFQDSPTREVKLNAQKAQSVNLPLAPQPTTRLTMTVTGSARETGEMSQAVDVLAGVALDRVRGGSLGETLASRPGVTQTAFGPTAGRPIIRGMSGDRIRVLEGGLGTGDVSTTSVSKIASFNPAATWPCLIDSISKPNPRRLPSFAVPPFSRMCL
ncbi:carboxypeptidase-like regulatory domain-containing protein [Acanthopleuribacter pedis]|uniref:Carboxypeptidase regulatory-like domain-containing protein n=1 Tax=Acanthopleuribacter pedis TaxID=442870 RepID=A0A8J7QE72_9BACT|nr:carboxypeptidase regulatory-like domain-containing protein [Acanthopleuribacter pedis]MBO1317468.1 carboxypeptidase regulatory-like domain-containing protein [Acanthopleuribacter pedis]